MLFDSILDHYEISRVQDNRVSDKGGNARDRSIPMVYMDLILHHWEELIKGAHDGPI